MGNYHITFENDQNIMLLDEEEIIKNSGFMLDYFFEHCKCHCERPAGAWQSKEFNCCFLVDCFVPRNDSVGEERAVQCRSALGYNDNTTTCFNHDFKIGFDLYVCDSATIQEINRDYRQKNEPTDVISFALFADCKESKIIIDNQINLGQIIISVEKTIEQANENDKDFLEEFYFLLSHGILHLLGFDHKDENSLEFMLDIQTKMCGNALYEYPISNDSTFGSHREMACRPECSRLVQKAKDGSLQSAFGTGLDEESVKNVKI